MSDAIPVQILLVEDNPGDVRLTQEILKDTKKINTLHVVEDGEKALQYLRQEGNYQDTPKPDLILLDLNLPKLDGREVLVEIKTDDKLKSIPVVILTTSSADEDIEAAYSSHANCYITKPVDLNQFLKVIHSIESFWLSVVKLPK